MTGAAGRILERHILAPRCPALGPRLARLAPEKARRTASESVSVRRMPGLKTHGTGMYLVPAHATRAQMTCTLRLDPLARLFFNAIFPPRASCRPPCQPLLCWNVSLAVILYLAKDLEFEKEGERINIEKVSALLLHVLVLLRVGRPTHPLTSTTYRSCHCHARVLTSSSIRIAMHEAATIKLHVTAFARPSESTT
jgi:hypothetical protein